MDLREARLVIRKSKRHMPDVEDVTALNITSMMDMMTIILVFLLKSFSVSAQGITPQQRQNFVLPSSTSDRQVVNVTLAVTVTQEAIVVEGYPVATVKRGIVTAETNDLDPGFYVDPSFKENGDPKSFIITPLEKELSGNVERLKKIAVLNPSEPFKGELMLVCDEEIPFRLVSEVLATAAQAGFGKYQLLTLQKGSKG